MLLIVGFNYYIHIHIRIRNLRDHNKRYVRKQVASYLAKNLPITHSTGTIGYYLCLFMQAQLQMGSYVHACTNETHSLANIQELISTLADIDIRNTNHD